MDLNIPRSPRYTARSVGAVFGAALLGGAWHLGTIGIMVSPAFVELWRRAETRSEAMAVALAYHAAPAYGVLLALKTPRYGALTQFDCLVWLGACVASYAAVWGVLWPGAPCLSPAWRIVRISAALLSAVCPGLAALAVASPLTAAGLWFPGLGWLGLLLLLVGLSVPLANVRYTVTLIALLTHISSQPGAASLIRDVAAIATQIPVSDDPFDFDGHFRSVLAAQVHVAGDASIIVLGEGLGGLWTQTMRDAWQPVVRRLEQANQLLVIGATMPIYESQGSVSLDNGAIVLGGREERIVRQRVPVPIAMWRPWKLNAGFRAHWLDRGVADVGGARLAILICYEQMLVLPVLLSLASTPDALIGLSNLQAFAGDSLAVWQRDATRSWAALFDLPASFAVNR